MLKKFEATGKTIEEAIDAAMLLAGDISNFDIETEVLENGSRGLFGIGSKPAKVCISFDDGKPEPAPVREFKPKEKKPIEFKLEDAKPVPRKEPKIRPAQAANEKSRERNDRREKSEKRDAFNAVSVKREPVISEEEKQAVIAKITAVAKPEEEITETERAAADAAIEFLQGIFAKMEVAPVVSTVFTAETINISCGGKSLGALIGRRGETLNALQYLTNLVVNRKFEGEHMRIVLDVEGYREEREETLVIYAGKMAEKCVRTGSKVELDPMNPHERRIVHITLEGDERVETVSYGSEPFRKVVIIPKNKKSRK